MPILNLNVEIDPESGFCFGVIEAIKKAEQSLNNKEELYCLGEIVHNDEEVNRLKNKGLKFINYNDFIKLKNKKVLFRAHSEPPESYKIAKKNNLDVIDASCSIIKAIKNNIKKSFDKNENVYIYGKHNHPEIIAINGYVDNKLIVFEKLEELDLENIPKSITLYSQTTQSLDNFKLIIKKLQNAGINVKVKDTICRQVSNRGPKIAQFCLNYDKIIFVAGTNSSNGKVLYNICKKNNNNCYFISSVNQIKQEWFVKDDKVGISGATSTPLWLMENVKTYLLNL